MRAPIKLTCRWRWKLCISLQCIRHLTGMQQSYTAITTQWKENKEKQSISDGTVPTDCPRTSNKHQPFKWVLCWFDCLTARGQKFGYRAENVKIGEYSPNKHTSKVSVNVRIPQIWSIFSSPWSQIFGHKSFLNTVFTHQQAHMLDLKWIELKLLEIMPQKHHWERCTEWRTDLQMLTNAMSTSNFVDGDNNSNCTTRRKQPGIANFFQINLKIGTAFSGAPFTNVV